MARRIEDLATDLGLLFDAVMSPKILAELGEKIRETIYKRTKTGKGLDKDTRSIGGSKNVKLADVSDNYREYRKGKITGPYPPSGKKSNLTLTGELLESMTPKVKGKEVWVEIDGQHSSGISMRKLLDEVSKKRPFFGLSDTELKLLDSFIRRKIRERLRELNKK